MRRSAFDRILREMQQIRYRLDDIESTISNWYPQPLEISETELLALPDHLRKTYVTVASKGECTAVEVANLTGRCRAAESNYLNQLARTGWLIKQRSMKTVIFRLVSGKTVKGMTRTTVARYTPPQLPPRKPAKEMPSEENACTDDTLPKKIDIKCLSSDYDGTISPLDVSRTESRVPLETRVMLEQIGKLLPISIITMKDLSFVMPRTPFARAWSAIGGLEMRVGKRVVKRESVEERLSNIMLALAYAKSQITTAGVEIEEKQDSEGRTVAFCVDWRQVTDVKLARREVERVADYCRMLRLRVLKYEGHPYFDVYPVDPDKGKGLKEMLNELSVKNGVLYLGDSEADNPAFRASSVSVGVVHNENKSKTLDCDYIVRFDQVPEFLKTLIANNFQFSSDFPMIKVNTSRQKSSIDVKKGKKAKDASVKKVHDET